MQKKHPFRARRSSPLSVSPITSVEYLESRTLLSAVGSAAFHPDLQVIPADTSAVQGYTPSQIRKAYGFDVTSFSNNSSVPADGSGQTIAIVDAFNDPTIVNDLGVFDTQFGLAAPPSFKVVNQSGGSNLPVPDAGWAGEIALDVEWAHAIAPKANIILVESDDASNDNLMAAVAYARTIPSVSVVSMSWGGSEFFSFSQTETNTQLTEDPTFTTPTGHTGITFIASAGDTGQAAGVQYPASSPNVVSVGGTSLFLQSDGTYLTESAWSGTNGGYSQVEAEPAYQNDAQSSGMRSGPDVSYVADPATGVAEYDSYADPSSGGAPTGWQSVGGTSAGAPQWAALVAIADQGRTLAGKGTLDGATQTLPTLYSLYSSPNSANYSSYTSDFFDVQSGGGGQIHWRWGYGANSPVATAGYDTATGLGSPKAQSIINVLATSTITGSTNGGSGSGGGGGSSQNNNLPASPLSGLLTGVPIAVLGGTSGTLNLRIQDVSNTAFSGPVSITLQASADQTASADDTTVFTISLPKLKLKTGAAKNVKLKFKYPANLPDGSYFLIASITAVGTNTAAAQVASSSVKITGPTVDLAASFAGGPVSVTAGKKASAAIEIQNLGNVVPIGAATLVLYSSTDQTLDSSDPIIITIPGIKVKIKPGKFSTAHIHFVPPVNLTPGSYNLIAVLTPSIQPADTNAANNVAVSATK